MNLPQADLYVEIREELAEPLSEAGKIDKSLYEREEWTPPPFTSSRPGAEDFLKIPSSGQPC